MIRLTLWQRIRHALAWPTRRLQRWEDEQDGPEYAMEIVRLVEAGDFDTATWMEREHLNPIQRRLGLTPTSYAARERHERTQP